MIKMWIDKDKCTGCEACANICPKKAIEMIASEDGFLYPRVNDNCINCQLCEKICENRLSEKNNLKNPICFAGWNTDKEIRFYSTSGGIFSAVAERVIDHDGVVYGAKYDDNLKIIHGCASCKKDLKFLMQSKYAQSEVGNCFKNVLKDLQQNKLVLFAGAPCQISGLKSFLKKEYVNLITLDFICRGVNSPKAFKSWLDEVEKKENKKITNVWFKYKEHGWNNSPLYTRLDFADGTYLVKNSSDNFFMLGYLGPNLYIRNSCSKCDFKGFPRVADISLGDFWKIDKELDDDSGTSLILCNNNKGLEVINNINERLFLKKMSVDETFHGNKCINECVSINKKSTKFLKKVSGENFTYLVKKYSKVGLTTKILNKIKRMRRS